MKNQLSFWGKVALATLFFVGATFSLVQAEDGFSIEVNLRETAMSYESNKVTISFDLTNGQGAQSGIKYGVRLLKGGEIIDEKVYDKVVSLGENEILSQRIKYTAPDFLQGEYSLQLVAENEAGISLSFETVGSVFLNGTNQYLFIDGKTCYATVQEENKHYGLDWGVDVSSEESLILNCSVSNYFDEKVEISPIFETYRRSTFGEKIEVELLDQGTFSLEAGETKELAFEISKPGMPQAYDTVLSLTKINQTQEKISNPVILHYVVKGGSATIQNIQLDKEVYGKGDVAKVSFYWTSSADDFYGSRSSEGTALNDIFIEGQIKGCSDSFYHTPTMAPLGLTTIEVPILKDCQTPKVSLTIKSGEQLLDEAIFKINQDNQDLYLMIILIVVALLILGGLSFFFLKKKKIGTPPALILLLLLGTIAIFGKANIAEAATWVSGRDPLGLPIGDVTYTYNYNDSSDRINIAFQNASYAACSNNGDFDWIVEVYHDDSFVSDLGEGKSTSFSKKTTSGTHTVKLNFDVNWQINISYDCYTRQSIYGASINCGGRTDCDLCVSKEPDSSVSFTEMIEASDWCRNVVFPKYSGRTVPGSDFMGSLFEKGARYIGSKTYTYTVADKPATCNIGWIDSDGENVSSVNVNEEVYLKWSSTNATSAFLVATGLTNWSGDVATSNSSWGPFKFSPAGPELATLTVKNGSGVAGSPCSASLTIKPIEKLSCELKFTPSSITAPGSSTATWSSSTNAILAKYSCNGPQSNSGDWGAIPTNGSVPFNFSVADAGKTETCTVEVKDNTGKTGTCSGSVSIKSSEGPSCTLTFTPPSVIAPGSSTATWSSSVSATSAEYLCTEYLCTGPQPGTGTWQAVPTSGSVPFNFSVADAGKTEACTLKVKDSAGKTGTCSGSVSIGIETPSYSCTGSIPSGYIAYDAEESTGLIVDTPWTLSVSDTPTKCQYYKPCIVATWEPSQATVCDGINLTQTSNCGTTRIVPGTKDCPSCTATFTPANIISPGSSRLTWSSAHATDIKYICTGPLPAEANYGSIPLNSPATPAVNFNFPFGPASTESCTFTVKDNTGEVGTCMTNSSTTGGGGGCVVNCGGVVTPHAPICSLDSSKNIVFLGDSTSLSWTSTYANSAEINRGVGQISPFVASSSKAVFPVVSETSDITYTGTFSGLGGSTNCSTDLITVVADPPEIVEGSFKISNQKTGLKPKAEWQTEKVVNCDLATDTGWSQTKVCSGEGCASVSDFLVNKVILKETTYTLTCYHQLGYPVIATYRPLGYFVLSANPTEVEVDFAGGGDWSEPDVELGIVSWNGYNSPISFSADLSGLPESPGDETTNEAAFAPGTLTFTDYFTNGIKSLAQFFASYRFEGDKTAIVNGNSESVEITIGSKKTIPIYEPY